MENQYIFLIAIMVFVVSGLLGVVSAEMLVSGVGVEYDSEILNAFENQTKIPIVVKLKDTSGIEIIGTKEEKIELMRQRDELFKPRVDEVLNTFQKDELELIGKHSSGFDAWVTRENLDKLIINSNVKSISWIKTGSHGNQEDIKNEIVIEKNDTIKTEIEKQESKFSWLWIVPLSIIFIIILYILVKRKN